MNPLPRISVVIISYNFERFLKECIDSILSQTLKPFEIVICDDHSTDRSWEIISQYGRQHPELIKAHRHKKNMGPFYNGTFGAKQFTGNFVCLMDGDDRWLPEKLELEWKALQRQPEAEIAYSNVFTIDADGRRTGVWHHERGAPPPGGDVFMEVFSRRFFSHSNSLFRNELVSRRAFEQEGHCDERLESYWDWDRKIRFAARFPVVYSGKALVEYRRHGASFSRQDVAKQHRAMIEVYEKNLPLLEDRPQKEAVWIRFHVESLFAFAQTKRPVSEQAAFFSLENVYARNVASLKGLLPGDRLALQRDLSTLLAKLCYCAARENRKRGHKKLALSHWLNSLRYVSKPSDLQLPLQIILPSSAYALLQTAYRQISK